MARGTSRNITRPRKKGRCQLGNRQLRTERIDDDRLRESLTHAETGAIVERSLPHREVFRGIGALGPTSGAKALVETEGRALAEVGKMIRMVTESTVHGVIDKATVVYTEADRQARAVETATAATTGRRTVESLSGPRAATKSAGALETQGSEAQADGEDREYPLPGHGIQPGRCTRVAEKRSAKLCPWSRSMNRKTCGITCRPANGEMTTVAEPVRVKTRAMETLRRRR
jgi:hypothetical protein